MNDPQNNNLSPISTVPIIDGPTTPSLLSTTLSTNIVPSWEPPVFVPKVTPAITTPTIPPGGGHYATDQFEPLKVGRANNWGYELTAVYKYTQRWEQKGGIEDLKKAMYLLQRFIAHKEGKE